MILDKLVWSFAEWCLNTPLLKIASERNEKLSRIENKNNTINEHIFKYYLMTNSIDRNHWLDEIDDRFFEIQNLKWWKNKRFRQDEYFNLLFTRFYIKDDLSIDYKKIERIFSKIEEKYKSEYQIDYSINDFVEIVGNILKEISLLIEKNEYDKSELIELMKEL